MKKLISSAISVIFILSFVCSSYVYADNGVNNDNIPNTGIISRMMFKKVSLDQPEDLSRDELNQLGDTAVFDVGDIIENFQNGAVLTREELAIIDKYLNEIDSKASLSKSDEKLVEYIIGNHLRSYTGTGSVISRVLDKLISKELAVNGVSDWVKEMAEGIVDYGVQSYSRNNSAAAQILNKIVDKELAGKSGATEWAKDLTFKIMEAGLESFTKTGGFIAEIMDKIIDKEMADKGVSEWVKDVIKAVIETNVRSHTKTGSYVAQMINRIVRQEMAGKSALTEWAKEVVELVVIKGARSYTKDDAFAAQFVDEYVDENNLDDWGKELIKTMMNFVFVNSKASSWLVKFILAGASCDEEWTKENLVELIAFKAIGRTSGREGEDNDWATEFIDQYIDRGNLQEWGKRTLLNVIAGGARAITNNDDWAAEFITDCINGLGDNITVNIPGVDENGEEITLEINIIEELAGVAIGVNAQDSYDFFGSDFSENMTVEGLVNVLISDYGLNIPEKTVEALNGILEMTGLYEMMKNKLGGNLELNSHIDELIDVTEDSRTKSFSELTTAEKRNIKILNRLLLSTNYKNVCPNRNSLRKEVSYTTEDNWAAKIIDQYVDRNNLSELGKKVALKIADVGLGIKSQSSDWAVEFIQDISAADQQWAKENIVELVAARCITARSTELNLHATTSDHWAAKFIESHITADSLEGWEAKTLLSIIIMGISNETQDGDWAKGFVDRCMDNITPEALDALITAISMTDIRLDSYVGQWLNDLIHEKFDIGDIKVETLIEILPNALSYETKADDLIVSLIYECADKSPALGLELACIVAQEAITYHSDAAFNRDATTADHWAAEFIDKYVDRNNLGESEVTEGDEVSIPMNGLSVLYQMLGSGIRPDTKADDWAAKFVEDCFAGDPSLAQADRIYMKKLMRLGVNMQTKKNDWVAVIIDKYLDRGNLGEGGNEIVQNLVKNCLVTGIKKNSWVAGFLKDVINAQKAKLSEDDWDDWMEENIVDPAIESYSYDMAHIDELLEEIGVKVQYE